MKKIFVMIAMICTMFSCNKESLNSDGTTQSKPDNILYQNLIPNVEIYTVRYFTPISATGYYFPTPYDSITEYKIDLNNDLIFDFVISAKHFKDTLSNYSCSAHSVRINYQITIIGTSTNNLISVKYLNINKQNNGPSAPCVYDTTGIITNNGDWERNSYLSFDTPGCTVPFLTSFKEMYIGIKMDRKFGWMHVLPNDKNGIIIKEFAVNLTNDNPIKAGQKE